MIKQEGMLSRIKEEISQILEKGIHEIEWENSIKTIIEDASNETSLTEYFIIIIEVGIAAKFNLKANSIKIAEDHFVESIEKKVRSLKEHSY